MTTTSIPKSVKRCANCQYWMGPREMLLGNSALKYDTNANGQCSYWRVIKRADGTCSKHIIISVYK